MTKRKKIEGSKIKFVTSKNNGKVNRQLIYLKQGIINGWHTQHTES